MLDVAAVNALFRPQTNDGELSIVHIILARRNLAIYYIAKETSTVWLDK